MLLQSHGFPLTKFFSNNKNLKTLIPSCDLAPVKSLNFDSENVSQNILGISWIASSDCFQFVYGFSNENVKKMTRCVILSIYSRIFDPIGFIQPFVLKPKLLIQELSRLKLDCDDVVSKNIEDEWQDWFLNIKNISQFSFDRCIIPDTKYCIECFR